MEAVGHPAVVVVVTGAARDSDIWEKKPLAIVLVIASRSIAAPLGRKSKERLDVRSRVPLADSETHHASHSMI